MRLSPTSARSATGASEWGSFLTGSYVALASYVGQVNRIGVDTTTL